MKPAPFEYHRPASLEEALEILAGSGGEAKLLAGGQSLVPAMNFRLAQPAVLVDLNRLAELAYVRAPGDPWDDDAPGAAAALRIGAMTRQVELERSPEVARAAPLIVEAMPHIAHPQIRSRGTAGGSIAHADPAAELPAVMLALGASFTLRSASGDREVPAEQFFTGLFGTALEPEEVLTEISVPAAPPHTGWAFDEISRRHGDFALAGACSTIALSADGRCEQLRIALFGVSDGPVLANVASGMAVGEEPTAELFAAIADAVTAELDPPGDIHATGDYRRHLAGVIVRRILPRALERARS